MTLKMRFKIWLAHKLPTCKEVTRMASDVMDRRLPLKQRIQMKLHFMTCSLCLRYFQQLQLMREMAHQQAGQIEEMNSSANPSLPSATRERFKRMLNSSAPE